VVVEVYRRSEKIREDSAVAAHPEGKQRRLGRLPQHHIENSALKAEFKDDPM
jgi:hypothetical protein